MSEPCPDWVDPEPFRDHVRTLICETGLPWRLIAAHAGVAPRAIRALLHGRPDGPIRRLHVSTARALAATSIDTIADAEKQPADSRPVHHLLRDLRRLGYPADTLETHLSASDLPDLSESRGWSCSRATAARITACYDLLTETRPPSRRVDEPPPDLQHVVCGQQHPPLDRKQTTWPIASSSPATARSS